MKTVSALTLALTSSAVLALTTDASPEGLVSTIVSFPSNSTQATTSGGFHPTAGANDFCWVGQDIDLVGGEDFKSVQADQAACCGLCKGYSKCVAYSWTNYQGGTCFLKSDVTGPITGKVAYGVKSALASPNYGPGGVETRNCDSPGKDIRSVPAADGPACGRLCWYDGVCKTATWTNYQGGTCFFKTGPSPCVTVQGAYTFTAFNEQRT